MEMSKYEIKNNQKFDNLINLISESTDPDYRDIYSLISSDLNFFSSDNDKFDIARTFFANNEGFCCTFSLARSLEKIFAPLIKEQNIQLISDERLLELANKILTDENYFTNPISTSIEKFGVCDFEYKKQVEYLHSKLGVEPLVKIADSILDQLSSLYGQENRAQRSYIKEGVPFYGAIIKLFHLGCVVAGKSEFPDLGRITSFLEKETPDRYMLIYTIGMLAKHTDQGNELLRGLLKNEADIEAVAKALGPIDIQTFLNWSEETKQNFSESIAEYLWQYIDGRIQGATTPLDQAMINGDEAATSLLAIDNSISQSGAPMEKLEVKFIEELNKELSLLMEGKTFCTSMESSFSIVVTGSSGRACGLVGGILRKIGVREPVFSPFFPSHYQVFFTKGSLVEKNYNIMRSLVKFNEDSFEWVNEDQEK